MKNRDNLFNYIFLAVVLIGFYLFITYYFWEFRFGLMSLGRFSAHSPYLLDGVLWIIGFGDGEKWQSYLSQIDASGAGWSVFLHLVFPAVLISIPAVWLFKYLYDNPAIPAISRGLVYLRDYSLAQRVARMLARKSDKTKIKFKIHPYFSLPLYVVDAGMAILAATGGGKSAILMPLCQKIQCDGIHRMLVHDKKGEYTQCLEDYTLIAPWDARSVDWDISEDIKTKSDARALAAQFIKSSDQSPMWGNAARAVFSGIIYYLIGTKKRWGFADITEILKLPIEELAAVLEQSSPESLKVMENAMSKENVTAQGVMINMEAYLSFVYDMAIAWPNPGNFSVKKWLSKDYNGPKTLILQNSAVHEEMANALISVLITTAVQTMADPQYPNAINTSDNKRVYYLLDEFDSLPKMKAINTMITVNRAKGSTTIITVQDPYQLSAKYGQDQTKALLSQFGVKIIGQIGSGDSAKWITENVIGAHEIEKKTKIKNFSGGKKSFSESNELKEQKIMLPTDLSKDLYVIKDRYLFALLLVIGWPAILRLRWPITKPELLRDAGVSATWVNLRPIFPSFSLLREKVKKSKKKKKALQTKNKQLFSEDVNPIFEDTEVMPPATINLPRKRYKRLVLKKKEEE